MYMTVCLHVYIYVCVLLRMNCVYVCKHRIHADVHAHQHTHTQKYFCMLQKHMLGGCCKINITNALRVSVIV
jgi:hypothetical protein